MSIFCHASIPGKASALYYKHIMTIVSDDRKWHLHYSSGIAFASALVTVFNYAPGVTLLIVALLTDNSRGFIYNHNMLIVPATGVSDSRIWTQN